MLLFFPFPHKGIHDLLCSNYSPTFGYVSLMLDLGLHSSMENPLQNRRRPEVILKNVIWKVSGAPMLRRCTKQSHGLKQRGENWFYSLVELSQAGQLQSITDIFYTAETLMRRTPTSSWITLIDNYKIWKLDLLCFTTWRSICMNMCRHTSNAESYKHHSHTHTCRWTGNTLSPSVSESLHHSLQLLWSTSHC